MKSRFFYLFALLFAITSCSPKITSNFTRTYQPQGSVDDVVLLGEKDPRPEDAEWMGAIDIKGKGNYESMAEQARFEAWRAGAKYVKVNKYVSEGVRSDIHVMNSDVFRADTVRRVSTPIPYANTVAASPSAGSNQVVAYSGPGKSVSDDVMTSDTEPLFEGRKGLRVYAGYGRRLNKLSPSLNEAEKMHVKRLLSGIALGADYVYYFNDDRNRGFGLRYQLMHSSSSDYGTMTIEDTGESKEGVLKDIVNISYIGPIYSIRNISSNGKNLVICNMGLGLLNYRMKESIQDLWANASGWTSGLTVDLSCSHKVDEHFSAGIGLSLTSGTITSITVSDNKGNKETTTLERDQWEGLLHMTACAQLVYTF